MIGKYEMRDALINNFENSLQELNVVKYMDIDTLIDIYLIIFPNKTVDRSDKSTYDICKRYDEKIIDLVTGEIISFEDKTGFEISYTDGSMKYINYVPTGEVSSRGTKYMQSVWGKPSDIEVIKIVRLLLKKGLIKKAIDIPLFKTIYEISLEIKDLL